MLFKPFLHLLRDGRLSALVGATAEFKSFYKLSYLAAAGEAGLLNRLASGPARATEGQKDGLKDSGRASLGYSPPCGFAFLCQRHLR